LVKCYFGYYRFSLDLDFTWRNQKIWKGLKKKELREKLLKETENFASFLERLCKEIGLDFKSEPRNKKYFEFGEGSKMVTFKLWKGQELIKIQVKFIEEVIFPPKRVTARTLLDNAYITEEERTYFKEFLDFYKPFVLFAYDEREVLCEKIRAILTRRMQKLRDFYDVFMLEKKGFKAENMKEEIIRKVRSCLRYKKYRENLEKNRKGLNLEAIFSDTFERSFFIAELGKDFERFLKEFKAVLEEIMKSL